jgi:hypothetical protein
MAGKQRYSAEQVCAALVETKGLLYLAAKHLACSYQTVCNYVQRYPSVKATLEAQRGEMVDTAEAMLYQSILKGEAWGITLCLKTLGKHRGYVERTELVDAAAVEQAVRAKSAQETYEQAERAHEQLEQMLEKYRVRTQEAGEEDVSRNGQR